MKKLNFGIDLVDISLPTHGVSAQIVVPFLEREAQRKTGTNLSF